MCHFCLVQVLPKFTNSCYYLHPAGSRFLLQSSEVQFQTFTPTHRCSQLCATCQHSQFKLFLPTILACASFVLFSSFCYHQAPCFNLPSVLFPASCSIKITFCFSFPKAKERLQEKKRPQSGKSGINHHEEGPS